MSPTPCAASPSAVGVVDSMYRWYFSIDTSRGGWREHLPAARRYFDPHLYDLLARAVVRENHDKGVILDFDPLFNAQVPATQFAVGTPVANGALVAVPVMLHFGKTPQTTRVSVILRKNQTWQVTNILYGPNGNLRSILEHALT